MQYKLEDLLFFCKEIYDDSFTNNRGGMGAPDLFTLHFALKTLQPKVVVESGVWNGLSTKLIRKTLPEATIICLDPRDIPPNGFREYNINTIYYTGQNFQDFSQLDLSMYNPADIFCFFDCHQNAPMRLFQTMEKKIKHVFFNDNYPENCGSHYTIQHLKSNDTRFSISTEMKGALENSIKNYHIFPNVFPGSIQTGEGLFSCVSFYKSNDIVDTHEVLKVFLKEQHTYRWNTYIEIV